MHSTHECGDECCGKICAIRDQMVCMVAKHADYDFDTCSVEELGEIIDMIKDLAEATKDIHKAEYYRLCSENMGTSFAHGDTRAWEQPHESKPMMPHEEPMTAEERAKRKMTDAKAASKSARTPSSDEERPHQSGGKDDGIV